MKRLPILAALFFSPLYAELAFKDTEGKHLDVVDGEKVLARYMYGHDASTNETLLETYKPYLHVFDAEGAAPITKGAGGKFPHHRGIFIGWNKIGVNGKTYDRWHMKGGEIVHQKFSGQKVENGVAEFTSVTHWMDEKGEPFLEEERSFKVSEPESGPERLRIDFESKLTPLTGDVSLQGDPEHSGVHFRPADEVKTSATRYVFPEGVEDVKKEKDLPWAAENFTLGEKVYGVVHLNDPANPKETRHSAYRDYGRFGAFFERGIPKGESLTVRYGFLIFDGGLPEKAEIQKLWEGWKGE